MVSACHQPSLLLSSQARVNAHSIGHQDSYGDEEERKKQNLLTNPMEADMDASECKLAKENYEKCNTNCQGEETKPHAKECSDLAAQSIHDLVSSLHDRLNATTVVIASELDTAISMLIQEGEALISAVREEVKAEEDKAQNLMSTVYDIHE
eukprot:scaffold124045_cov50-Prasinocladus_malaysianus.AAC.1